jgi:hypothetical protein
VGEIRLSFAGTYLDIWLELLIFNQMLTSFIPCKLYVRPILNILLNILFVLYTGYFISFSFFLPLWDSY